MNKRYYVLFNIFSKLIFDYFRFIYIGGRYESVDPFLNHKLDWSISKKLSKQIRRLNELGILHPMQKPVKQRMIGISAFK